MIANGVIKNLKTIMCLAACLISCLILISTGAITQVNAAHYGEEQVVEEEVVETDSDDIIIEEEIEEPDKSHELEGKQQEIDKEIRSQLELLSDYRLDDVEKHRFEEDKLHYRYMLEDVEVRVDYDKQENIITEVNKTMFTRDDPKLAQVTADEAEDTALKYVETLYPELLDDEKLNENPLVDRELDDSQRGASNYEFTFMRIHDGIPVQDEGVTVEINAVTGELSRIEKDFSKPDKFISLEETVSKEEAKDKAKDEAKEKLMEDLPLKKVYLPALDDNEFQEPNLFYTLFGQLGVEHTGIIRTNYLVDANSGDMISRGFYEIDGDKLDEVLAEDGSLSDEFLSDKGVTIDGSERTEEITEEKAVELAEDFVNALGFEGFEVEDVDETEGVRRSPLGSEDDRLLYEVNLEHEDVDEFRQLSVKICQEQGDIYYYDIDRNTMVQVIDDIIEDRPEKINIDEESEKTLNKLSPASDAKLINSLELNAVEVDEEETMHFIIENPEDYDPGSTSRGAEYSKVVNNIPVKTAGYNLQIDMATGLANRMIYIPLIENELPDPQETDITLEEAREKLVSELDLELVYIPHRSETGEELMKIHEDPDREPTVKMRPAFKLSPYAFTASYDEGAPYVHADSGELYNFEGTSFIDKEIFELVEDGHWAASYLELALAQGLLPLRQGELLPDEDITKEEVSVLLAQIIYMRDRSPEVPEEPYFDNVGEDHPHFEAIQLLTKKDIFDKGQETFPLDETINREQMAELIVKSLDLDILMVDNLEFPLKFEDVDEISLNKKDCVGLVTWLDIMNGDGDKFSPKDKLSRAEAVTMLYRIDEIEELKN
ncbi:YcdB/YcdC domain-containing protein [Natranaerobius thermophilus]|uniref:SLH domain-containing protein n=1 Tax=Natranaerobius thermophilus (strain ATCC BAA-1301 / DSM 18059 / JW/NM-WN-LF) TaxID=457570 RepID=B2A1S2_NATTJ|nr:S-layer homology domain-containing protein [Natranaerobius thermophilus]ACB86119.1 hypothetical protein Nther_2561 [Natranaerobius thermophilus JW/NM-WN-LF]